MTDPSPRAGADLSRYDDWLGWLREHGETDGDVRVVFIGGSAVTGGYDDHSDLDVEVLATPGEAVAAYRRLLDAAPRGFEGHHVWGVPRAARAPGPQAVLQPTPAPRDKSPPPRGIHVHGS